MLLAPVLLAAALAQPCAGPPSRHGPPPCAAANVPGCLPGYHAERDTYGRTIYVCDTYAEAPDRPPAPPPDALPPPPRYAPRYSAPWPPPSPPREPRGLVGLVLMPGGTSVDRGRTNDPAGSFGLELRPPAGGIRLRLGYEASQPVRALELGLKYDFFDGGPVRPFLALGVGGASLDVDPGWSPSASLAGGVDLYLTRNLFASLEVKQRAFSQDTRNGYEPVSHHQTSFFFGLGFYL